MSSNKSTKSSGDFPLSITSRDVEIDQTIKLFYMVISFNIN
jgi:hypothetical protein